MEKSLTPALNDKSLVSLPVRRPVLTTVIFLIVIVIGIFSLTRLPIDLMPEITMPTVTVVTTYDGAGPLEIEELITRPIEASLSALQGIEEISSTSVEGRSTVRVTFPWGTDQDAAVNDMRDRIDRIMAVLPDGVDRPLIRKFDVSAMPIMILGVMGEGKDISDIQQILEDQVQYRIERVPGVASVDIRGGRRRQIQVNLRAASMEAYGISTDMVVNALRRENRNIPAGSVISGNRDIMIRTLAEYAGTDDVKETAVTVANGVPVRIADVADVVDGYEDITSFVRINGQPGIRLMIGRQSGSNTVAVANGVNREIARVNQDFPELEIMTLIDNAQYVERAMSSVAQALLLGGGIAIFVLLLFLRNISTTVIISVSIPISIIATFALIYFAGFTLNMMTFGGLALGIGMLLDNAIVVLDNIYHKREHGMEAKAAAVKGTSEVISAVCASTLTTVVVFIPVIFMRGMTGIMFMSLAFVIGFSIACSLLVAVTMVPMLSSRYLKMRNVGASLVNDDRAVVNLSDSNYANVSLSDNNRANVNLSDDGRTNNNLSGDDLSSSSRENLQRSRADNHRRKNIGTRIFDWSEKMYLTIERRYRKIINWSLRNRATVVVSVLMLFVTALLLLPSVGVDLMPAADESDVRVAVELEIGTKLDRLDETVRVIEEIVEREVPEAQFLISFIGGGGGFMGGSTHTAQVRAALVPVAKRERSSAQVADDLRAALRNVPGATIRVREGQSIMTRVTSGGDGAVGIEIRGYDLETGQNLAQQISSAVREIPAVTDVTVSREAGMPEFRIRVDRARAAESGLSAAQIGATVQTAMAGTRATQVRVGGKEYDILVRLAEEDRRGLDNLNHLTILNTAQNPIALSSAARIESGVGPVRVERRDRERIVNVSVNYTGTMGAVVEEIRRAMRDITVPQEFAVLIRGDWEEQQRAQREMIFGILMAILLIFLVMAGQFESFKDPFVVLFSIPMALIGVVAVMLLTGTPFTIQAFIGCIILVGIVVNNAIVLVDLVNRMRREDGIELFRALEIAGERRLRPILMTSLTTCLGLLPMAIGLGEGSETQIPMARVVIGGLLVSTLITLVFIPVVYSLVEQRKKIVS